MPVSKRGCCISATAAALRGTQLAGVITAEVDTARRRLRSAAAHERATRPPRTQGPPMGSLKAVTTNLRAGYLRKNGLPYSENAS